MALFIDKVLSFLPAREAALLTSEVFPVPGEPVTMQGQFCNKYSAKKSSVFVDSLRSYHEVENHAPRIITNSGKHILTMWHGTD